ncbi:glycosyltransferase family 2 protein [Krasilnikovia sp. M28-CT-15]|uniref:glycosyltransferase family 2 protein n=1 Tax=Krasilnikovia sp. M28-CT-15 TaxID=3373540 RepID=UPI0038764EF8
MSVSIVIPCFRSTATLPPLVEGIAAAIPIDQRPYEIILVVDDDEDDTWELTAELARRGPAIRAIRLSRNYGQHNAIVAGIRAARHEVIITMDDDLQHPSTEIPVLLAALTPEFDLVYGVSDVEEHRAVRSLASRGVKWVLAWALGIRDARSFSALRAFRAHLTPVFDRIDGPHASIDVALSWATSRITATTVRMRPRPDGRSGYTLRSLARHTANMVFGFSIAPLRLVTMVGLAVGLVGLALFGKVTFAYFTGATTVAGFTTIASMVALFASAQLIALGVLGEYVGRIHTVGMGRPNYLIRESAPDGPHETGRVPESRDAQLVTAGWQAGE